MVEVIRYLAGLALAIGLGLRAWRTRDAALGLSAVAYLAAVQYLRVNPELVLAAGAVVAHALATRPRPWHAVVVAGLLGALWQPVALVLVLAGVVLAGSERRATRPGAWFPPLVAGAALAAWRLVDDWARRVSPPEPPAPVFPPGSITQTLSGLAPPAAESGSVTLYAVTSEDLLASYAHAVSPGTVDHDVVALAVAVALALGVVAWRRRSAHLLLTAAAYLCGTWVAETTGLPWWRGDPPV
ncbi:hypothetical protein, partial [Saccharothrix sp. Mg75]|uniref:hypothetical protein n=1 Tax=Saccharothrix sp. Mg75 TaxID=3445357 RepID=UPI003EEF3CC4